MKLRKALDRAKLAREGLVQTSLVEKQKIKEIKPPAEWRPPVYSESAHIELNTETILNNRCICIEPNSPEIDCYKVLRTKIQLLTRQKGWKTPSCTHRVNNAPLGCSANPPISEPTKEYPLMHIR